MADGGDTCFNPLDALEGLGNSTSNSSSKGRDGGSEKGDFQADDVLHSSILQSLLSPSCFKACQAVSVSMYNGEKE